MDAILGGRISTFAEIACAERLVERDVHWLAPLAFLSAKIVRAIVGGNASAGLIISRLMHVLPHAWAAQNKLLGFG